MHEIRDADTRTELEDWLVCPECSSETVIMSPSDGETLIQCQDCGVWTRI